MSAAFISIRNLSKEFPTAQGVAQVLRHVSFDIPRGSITGLVGESGSGKTTLGRVLLRLIEPTAGQLYIEGTEFTRLGASHMRRLRRRMQIIFQDPFSSLNPRMRIKDIVGEGLACHKLSSSRRERTDKVAALLDEVGLAPEHMNRYPHEFSGGQRQRIGIARALAMEPEFIVADESVSALDVSVQAQILNLLLELRERRSLTILFIAHDLSVVNYLCDQVVVLYLGRPVEIGSAEQVFGQPTHPYTRALLSAIPVPDPAKRQSREILKGDIPSPLDPPSGCPFRTRCRYATEHCARGLPEPESVELGHLVFCKNIGSVH